MSKIWEIARYTIVGNLRNRVFGVLILFGLLLLGASVLLGLLSQEQELRMLLDLGLAAIEMLALLTAIFLVSSLILEEIESRTIYLVLTRSVGRMEYLLGRFLGTVASVLACVLAMTAAHVAVLLMKGWQPGAEGALYALSVLMSFEKVLLISSLALFFSLFSSSAVTALVFTFFFWMLGHFAMEMRFLSDKLEPGFVKAAFKGVYLLIPHFQYLNARDLWIAVADQLPSFVLRGSVYAFCYTAAGFVLALLAFRKKEF